MILEGSADTIAFEVYVEQILAPSLHTGQIVIMDNLQAHKSARITQIIEAKGCQLLFLPSYSPDLSPIEEAFSKLKAHYDEREHEPGKPWKRPLLGRYSPSPHKMPRGGFSTAATCFLDKKGRANMAQ